jgi:ribosome-binding protein aMBF1 (putative translation factor)
LAGRAVREARHRAGLSREQLGQQLKTHGYRRAIDASTVGRWERGEKPIPKLVIPHLEDILNIEIPR